jgi:Cellulase (glycosyl hydrolase family 5)
MSAARDASRIGGVVARLPAVVVCVTILLSVCVSGSTADADPSTAGPTRVPPLVGALHVVHPPDATAYLADAEGRQVELRGVAVVGMEDIAYTGSGDGPPLYPTNPSDYQGRCPKTSPLGSQGPLCEVEASKPPADQSTAPGSDDDFAEIRSLGMNVVRLVIDWSELEPTPGHYSSEFLDRVAQVVGWARAQGISVILDMHEDQYSRFVLPTTKNLPSGCTPSGGYDGAPRWAVFTDGEPSCEQFGESDLNPAVAAAFDNFWHNRRVPGALGESPGPGLQDEYIGALAALARRFSTNPAVIGYELMNEPLPGAHSTLPLTNVVTFSDQYLYPFYRHAIEALTGVRDGLATCPRGDPSGSVSDGPPPYPAQGAPCAYPDLGVHTHQLVFFEPTGYRNLLDFSPQDVGRFSSYSNLVFAPHVYTHAFTIDTFVGVPLADSTYPPSYTFGYQTAEAEARAMGSAVLTTEFGDDSGSDSEVLSNEIAAQDRSQITGTLWAWDGLAPSEADCWCVRYEHSSYQTSQNGLRGNGNPHAKVGPSRFIASRVALLSQPLPLAVNGHLESWVSSSTEHAFAIDAVTNTTGTALARPTLVEIPASWSDARVSATGGKVVVERLASGARLAVVNIPARGTYSVTVAAPGKSVATAASGDASAPLQPIGYSTALSDLEQFISTSERSPDKTVASNAGLLTLLAKTVLGVTG